MSWLWLDVDHINGATYIHVAHLEFMLLVHNAGLATHSGADLLHKSEL